MPAPSAILREMYKSLGMTGRTLAMTAESRSAAANPERSIAALAAVTPRSSRLKRASEPPNFPMGKRAAETKWMSVMVVNPPI